MVVALLVALAGAFVAALALGAVKIPFGDVIASLTGGDVSAISAKIINDLRLPRAVEAIVVGCFWVSCGVGFLPERLRGS